MNTTRETYEQLEGNSMMNYIVKIIVMIWIVTGAMGTAQASISQPPVVFAGPALSASSGSTITITLAGEISPLASCKVSVAGATLMYLLRVPMDDVGARIPGAARMGDSAVIAVDGVQAATVVIPKFGTLVVLPLGIRSPEQWAKDHLGDDGSGDMNKNGISDLAEYLSGKDPAGCVWTAVDGTHSETTVYHTKVLASCLIDAGKDAKHNLIRVARGTYAGNYSYAAAWGENFDLTVTGGYDPGGSGERLIDPTSTILDGDTDSDQVGNGIIISIDTDTNKTIGKVHIESLTFKNGKAPTGQSGAAIQAKISLGDLELVGNIFTSNSTDSVGGAIFAESRGNALIFLTNNLLYQNSAASAAALLANSTAGGHVVLLNNTIVENAATANGEGRSILIRTTAASAVDLTNNIISGFASVIGKDIYISNSDSSTPVIMNNALNSNDLLINTSGFTPDVSNLAYTPQFMDVVAGDYRLSAASTYKDKGLGHARLGSKDIVGTDRISDGAVDLGAYEIPVANFTINGTVLSGTGTVLCAPLTVPAGGSTTCTLTPGSGWYTSALTDNTVNDVLSQVNNNAFVLLNVQADHTVEARFQEFLVRRLSNATTYYHLNLQDALDHTVDNDKILLLDMLYAGNIVFDRPASVLVEGGHVSGTWILNPAVISVIQGRTDIINGKVVMKNTVIR